MKSHQKNNRKAIGSVTRGSGNVFADLGFGPEAGELHVKAELTRQIYNRIKSLGLTQSLAGQRLGLSQPDVSKLMNAKFTGYSTDRLIALLSTLEVDVDIVVRPHRRNRRHKPGVIRIREAAKAA
jgi:predicted XRE-type DNA-binding protein